MSKYSIAAIIFILLNIISLILLTFLIIKLCKSSNCFTKYTQLQLFIAAWGYTIGLLPTVIKYGDDINKAFETQASICVIQQMISLFFFYPLHLFPSILGFYLWYATDKRNIEVEKKYFWIFSCIVWCFTVCFNVFSFADGYVNENFGIRVTPLLCKPPNSNLHIITYVIIIPLLFCISLIFTYFTSAMLLKRWQHFSVRKNRWTALRLGHALRLFTCNVIYVIFLGISLSSRITSKYVKNSTIVEDFVQSFSGIILFLIFAKSDSPTVFLPSFYYGDPANLIFKSDSYARDDSFLFARPPSLPSSVREITQIRPPPNAVVRKVKSRTKLLTIMEETGHDTIEEIMEETDQDAIGRMV